MFKVIVNDKLSNVASTNINSVSQLVELRLDTFFYLDINHKYHLIIPISVDVVNKIGIIFKLFSFPKKF